MPPSSVCTHAHALPLSACAFIDHHAWTRLHVSECGRAVHACASGAVSYGAADRVMHCRGPEKDRIPRESCRGRGSLHLTPLGAVTGSRWIIGISTPPGIKCFNYDYYRNAAELRITNCCFVSRYSRYCATRFLSPMLSGELFLFFSFFFFEVIVEDCKWFGSIEEFFWVVTLSFKW